MPEKPAPKRSENQEAYAHVQSVREAIRVLMQTEGIDALGSVEAVRRSLRYLVESNRTGDAESHAEAALLYEHVTRNMLGPFLWAARKKSRNQLDSAALSMAEALDEFGVPSLESSLIASKVAYGVSDALHMSWKPDWKTAWKPDSTHGRLAQDANRREQQQETEIKCIEAREQMSHDRRLLPFWLACWAALPILWACLISTNPEILYSLIRTKIGLILCFFPSAKLATILLDWIGRKRSEDWNFYSPDRAKKGRGGILFKALNGVTTILLSLPLVLVMLSPAIDFNPTALFASHEETSVIENTDATDEFDADLLEDSTSGMWGTCAWELDDDGVLWIHEGTGEVGRADESPWSGVANRVLQIHFDDGVTFPETSWYLFYSFPLVEEIDLGPCDLSNVSDARQMFSDCVSLRTVKFGNWHANKVTKLSGMFQGCMSLASVDVASWDVSHVTDMGWMFEGCLSLRTVDVSKWDTSSVLSMSSMFEECKSLASIDVSHWDTSGVSDMIYCFSNCASLKSIDVSGWDTSRLTDMYCMFRGCTSLTELNASRWNTSNVTRMAGAFLWCRSLGTIDASRWDTSNVTDIGSMFEDCASLRSLNLSSWNTSKITDMSGLFARCSSLSSLDVSGWDTTSVTDMAGTFNGCASLTTLDLGDWETPYVQSTRDLFSGCAALEELYLNSWNTQSVTDCINMFEGCTSLRRFTLGPLYDAIGARMVPDATSSNGQWYCVNTKEWKTEEDIVHLFAPARLLSGPLTFTNEKTEA